MHLLVSVIIPTYNRGLAIKTTIDSAVSQTTGTDQIEVLVVDDGSCDGSADFIEAFYKAEKSVRVIRQRNRGVAAARNRGLKEARGEYIAYLDHDDVWLPNKLENQLAVMHSNRKAAVAYSRWIDVDESLAPLPDAEQTTRQPWWQPREGRVHAWFCAPRNPIVSMSVPLIRTDALREVGGFDSRTVPADDLDLWLRLSNRYDFVYVPQELVLYVHHDNQQGSDPRRTGRAMRRVYAKHWPCLLRHPSMLWYVATFRFFVRSAENYQKAKALADQGETKRFVALTQKTLSAQPLALFSPQWIVLLWKFLRRQTRPKSE